MSTSSRTVLLIVIFVALAQGSCLVCGNKFAVRNSTPLRSRKRSDYNNMKGKTKRNVATTSPASLFETKTPPYFPDVFGGAQGAKGGLPLRTSAATPQQERKATSWYKSRNIMCYLLCGSRVFQQSMRNTLTNLLVYMSADMSLSTAAKGSMLSAIATGYFFTQVPGGALADIFGPKNVMTMSLLLSAICCILVPIAADSFGLNGIWFVMALMGAVQGPMFPTSSVFLSRWMPASSEPGMPDEKAWGTSMLDIGISIGSLLIIPIVTTLAEAFGWRKTFFCVGGASLGYVALWIALAASAPSECWFISQQELDHLNKHVTKLETTKQRKKDEEPPPPPTTTTTKKQQSKNKRKQTQKGNAVTTTKMEVETSPSKKKTAEKEKTTIIGMPWAMALHKGLWAVFICHIAFNFGAYYLTNWSPTYYKDVLGLEPKDAKFHLMCPHVTNLIIRCFNPTMIQLVSGALGCSLIASRKLFTAVGFTMAAVCLLPAYSCRAFNPWVSTILFSLANGFFGLAPTGFKSNYLDITQKYVGIVAGYGNTLGTVASIVGPKLTAATLIATNQNWNAVIATVCAVNILASMNYLKNAVVTPIEKIITTETLPTTTTKPASAAA